MGRSAPAPPYQRIADHLRARIAAGQLRPGDRVPSTRELARVHRVAMATAAHALRSLADEGLVHGVSRVGTVVAGARPRGRGTELSRSRIVEAAIAVADAEGLAALSLRGVAARLDAPVMSLYRHVKSKEELLLAMTDSVLGEDPLPASPPVGWRAQLELAAQAEWRAFKRHPWLARVLGVTRPAPLPNALAHAEWVLRALDGHGLDAAQRMDMHVILHGFIQGIAANLEAEAEAAGETGLTDDEWMQRHLGGFDELASSGRYPAFASVLGELAAGFDLDLERVLATGLDALLDGFGRLVADAERRTRASGPAPQVGGGGSGVIP